MHVRVGGGWAGWAGNGVCLAVRGGGAQRAPILLRLPALHPGRQSKGLGRRWRRLSRATNSVNKQQQQTERLPVPPHPPPLQATLAAEVVEALRGCEEAARRRHVGMWVHGDPGSDEEEDAGFPALGGAAKGRR